MNTNDQVKALKETLQLHSESFRVSLTEKALTNLSKYFLLVMKWNPRLHLVSPSSPEVFALRHVLESLWLLQHLPPRVSVADVGSGAGLPLVPCLIVRPDLGGILIESSSKKAVFLREALKLVDHSNRAQVIAERFELLPSPEVNFVTSRALDSFQELLPRLIEWSPRQSTLLLFGGQSLRDSLDRQQITYQFELIPNSDKRFLFSFKRQELL